MQSLFSIREKEIFATLKALNRCNFVLIGGYAVNAYTLPRFSVDCDIVIKNASELKKIETALGRIGYGIQTTPHDVQYSSSFARLEKKLENDFMVSIDVLIGTVIDRMTGVNLMADWIFTHSETRSLKGKTIARSITLRIITLDALIAMKIISCRPTDIRDVFMMLPSAVNKKWIIAEISSRYDFNDRLTRIVKAVRSKQFKDGLSGVYGAIDQKTFDKHIKSVSSFQPTD